MKFKIHWKRGEYQDDITIEGENINQIELEVKKEMVERGWKDEECWSEEI